MRDLNHNIGTAVAIPAAVYAAGNSGVTIDRQNCNALTFVLSVGVGGITFTTTNRIDFIMEHSDDGTTWSPVVATNVLGATPDTNGIVVSLISAQAAATVTRVGYIDGLAGDKRYVRTPRNTPSVWSGVVIPWRCRRGGGSDGSARVLRSG